VGSLLDATVLIEGERSLRDLPAVDAVEHVFGHLKEQLGPAEEVGIAVITASELLHGVHRADAHHRARREAYVEAVLAALPPLPLDLIAARVHARLWAALAAAGEDVGAHDRLVAATAIAAGWRVATANVRHFRRIPGLEVIEVSMKA
jgi:tRNA(fMet)-specific endonuclease VapC